MNLLFSCIGKRGYIADFFRPHLRPGELIIGTGNTMWTPGFLACDRSFLLPDIVDDAYIPAVLDLCEREAVDAVLSLSDPDVFKLAHARQEFAQRGIVCLLPSAEVATIAFDKYRTFEFLSGKGLATPRTAIRLEEASDFSFPMYVKPRRGSGGHDTFRARNEAELKVFFSYRPDMIIQEEVVGEEVNIELCGDLDGRPVGLSMWRKLRSQLGETERADTFHDPEMQAFALHLGEIVGAVGPMDVDLIRTTDELVVLELNPRFGGGYPVSHLAGADFPRLLMELLRAGSVASDFSYAAGVAMMKRLDIIGGPADEFFQQRLGVR